MRRTLAALLLVLLAAGCRPDGEEVRLTPEEYRTAADRICAEYESRLDDLDEPESLEDLARLAEEAEPIAEEGLRELQALEAPEELEPQVDEWLDRNEENVRAIGELREAAEAGDDTRVRELASAALDNEAEADRLAAELGLEDCAASDR